MQIQIQRCKELKGDERGAGGAGACLKVSIFKKENVRQCDKVTPTGAFVLTFKSAVQSLLTSLNSIHQ